MDRQHDRAGVLGSPDLKHYFNKAKDVTAYILQNREYVHY
jgi:hypothetical protein